MEPRRAARARIDAGPKLQGRVLLVEDNPINQGVATAMLNKLGLEWVLATRGAEAVAQVREAGFDLVLMDCQMPVMDGYQATAAIRALPDERSARVPIIALTANTMQGDEQACLQAGMDAFLAKPYTLAALQATLARWLPARADACRRQVPPQPAPGAAAVLNLKAIDTLRETRRVRQHGRWCRNWCSRSWTPPTATSSGSRRRSPPATPTRSAKAAHPVASSAATLGAESRSPPATASWSGAVAMRASTTPSPVWNASGASSSARSLSLRELLTEAA